MQLPFVDRTPSVRPIAGAEGSTHAPHKGASTQDVQPTPAAKEPSPVVQPGVVNHVKAAAALDKTADSQATVYDKVSGKPKAASDKTPYDWTLRKANAEKSKDPPPKPIAEVLMENLKTVWSASASAVQHQAAAAKAAETATSGAAPSTAVGSVGAAHPAVAVQTVGAQHAAQVAKAQTAVPQPSPKNGLMYQPSKVEKKSSL